MRKLAIALASLAILATPALAAKWFRSNEEVPLPAHHEEAPLPAPAQ
jgi:hypothetical protein